jgi:hypothetical protein
LKKAEIFIGCLDKGLSKRSFVQMGGVLAIWRIDIFSKRSLDKRVRKGYSA